MNCAFPVITTPHHEGPVTRDAPDSFLVQGVLKTGTVVSFSMFLTPPGAPSSFTWTIAGEKGALKFEANNINIQIVPPKLYWYHSRLNMNKPPEWQEVPVEDPLAFGQVGELYQAIADAEKVPGILTDFDQAALRHSMLEACVKSARDGTREKYA